MSKLEKTPSDKLISKRFEYIAEYMKMKGWGSPITLEQVREIVSSTGWIELNKDEDTKSRV